jgi:asparagine synthase (glutamine-hydrolysing)
MCGIAGILSFAADRPVQPARLAAMRDTLAHRGPDEEGMFVDGTVGLAHRRLAIVDVAGGQQPMCNEDRSIWVVFNGEIYNHADLRPDLIERGHRYSTRSDTETIIHVYEEYGDSGLERLEGMFAFALWDASEKRLLLVRDRLGIKPLYYSVDARELLFASEVKALIAGGHRARLNADVLPEYLASRYVSGSDTFFQDVKKLLPGHALSWSPDEGMALRRYWHLPSPQPDHTTSLPAEAADLRVRLTHAVRRHLMSDVPLGVFLSGGIDSSALAALAATLIPEPVKTFAVGFSEAEGNELPYARLVARKIGADHHEVSVSGDEYFDALPELILSQDEPMAFSSGVPLYFVSRLARDHVKVVLTGEGADELFLGYNRYRVTAWNQRLGAPFWALTTAPLRAHVRQWIGRMPRRARRYVERTFLALDPGDRALVFDNFAVFPEPLRRALVAADATRDPYAFGLRCYREASGGPLERMSATDLQTYLCELLMKQDRMSMAASIESRVPFLDDQLVARVASMPARLKLRGWQTKAVFRRAVRDLVPHEVLTRRKMGFPVPLARWLRGAHWPVVEEFVTSTRAASRGLLNGSEVRRLAAEHRSGRADHAERLWLLINLEIWQRMFCEGETAQDVMRPLRRGAGKTHARSLDQDGRSLAAQHRRPAAHVPPPLGVVAPQSGGAADHAQSR